MIIIHLVPEAETHLLFQFLHLCLSFFQSHSVYFLEACITADISGINKNLTHIKTADSFGAYCNSYTVFAFALSAYNCSVIVI